MSQQRLVHFSGQPLTELLSVAPRQEPHGKPAGFWFSVEPEYGWRWWCQGERFNLENFAYETEIEIVEPERVLWIKNQKDLDRFTKRYGVDLGCLDYPGRPKYVHAINWKPIVEKYAGIVIAPYQWGRRLDGGAMWYYGWDCASGCAWDASAFRLGASRPHVLDPHILEEMRLRQEVENTEIMATGGAI